jgi:hypothetical protein
MVVAGWWQALVDGGHSSSLGASSTKAFHSRTQEVPFTTSMDYCDVNCVLLRHVLSRRFEVKHTQALVQCIIWPVLTVPCIRGM